VSDYPEVATLEDHLVVIASAIEAFAPQRVAVDSLSALERVAAPGALASTIRATPAR
jgi:circadian clock protein KaiC